LKVLGNIWTVLTNKRGSQTIEYVAVMVGAALLAIILTEVMESNEIQNALKEKIECVILENCSESEVAQRESKPIDSVMLP
jgi:hypothetical protein